MTTVRHRRGPRGDISAEDILRAAERLLDTGGAAALTLRAVASEAGVTPTAVYTYFGDMADLRNRLGDDFLGRLDLGLLGVRPPAQALHRFLRHVLEVAEAAPGHVQVLATQRVAGPHSLALNEAFLEYFSDAVGHPPNRAAGLTTLVTEWLHGRLLLSPSNAASAAFTTALATVDLADYPRSQQMLATNDDGSALDLLVSAITRMGLPPAEATGVAQTVGS
ncbi:TetR/AcrR family transcriptional regulator [Occultella gossypii]|uniref:TetR/AcrR family transcriptional regulator n=1 Tax=Occultella gossypii TaxID=2800820 RepID=A0ABS7SDS4_9MICO|nr:TetR/AcrR family transcriptional regulator [Occultella gossypii]MBZ2198494.1 TetR/AcrR family transcriptional regulator [Occultella gossypii]